MTDKVVVKIRSKELIELLQEMVGLRRAIRDLAKELGRIELQFWRKAAQKYKLEIPEKVYYIDYLERVIVEKENC